MCRTPDCCGVILAVFTVMLLAYGSLVTNYFSIFYWYYEPNASFQFIWGIPLKGMGIFYAFTFNFCCVMSFFSHLKAAFVDPGIIPKFDHPPLECDPQRLKYCKKCDMQWKPERAHHCSECEKCIFKMDHHCPWVNNCVGLRNLKYFILFILYTAMASVYTIYLMILSFYFLMTAESKIHQQKNGYAIGFVLCILAFIEGILFAFFCIELVQEQLQSIQDNQTYIDDMKDLYGRPQLFIHNCKAVMGHDWKWWLIPTIPVLKINYLEKLYTIKQLQKINYFDEEDTDPDNKILAQELKRSEKEKLTLFWICIIAFVIYLVCKLYN